MMNDEARKLEEASFRAGFKAATKYNWDYTSQVLEEELELELEDVEWRAHLASAGHE